MYKLANWCPRTEINKPMFTPDKPYEFEVLAINPGVYSTGTPKWDLVLNIFKENGQISLFKTSIYAGLGFQIYAFLEGIGADFLWEKLGEEGIDLNTLIHRSGKLIFKNERYQARDGEMKDAIKIKKFLKKSEAVKSAPPEMAPLIDDEIPWG